MSGMQICLGDDCLFVESEFCEALARVPLELAKLSLAGDGETGNKLLVLRTRDADDIEARCSWLFIVEDGLEATARLALELLSLRGAFRVDFADTFRIVGDKPLGAGLTAEVWRADAWSSSAAEGGGRCGCGSGDGQPERLAVAAKVYKQAEPGTASMAKALVREISLLTAVQGHPNVIRFHGLFQLASDELPTEGFESVASCSPRWCLTTELCSSDLFSRVVRSGGMQEPDAKEVMVSVLGALAHIHELGILHRDVKAENIMIKDDGSYVLADFGLSCRMSEKLSVMQPCGSPGYIAPEVLLKKGWQEESDVFSAGVVLYVVFGGGRPFAGCDVKETLQKTVQARLNFSRRKCFDTVSSRLKAFLRLLLSKAPEHRPRAKDSLQTAWFMEDPVDLPNAPTESCSRADPAFYNELATPIAAGSAASLVPCSPSSIAPSHAAVPNDLERVECGSPEDDGEQAFRAFDEEPRGTSKGSTRGSGSFLSVGSAPWKYVQKLSARMTGPQPRARPNVVGRPGAPLGLRRLVHGGAQASSVAARSAANRTEGGGSSASTAWTAVGRPTEFSSVVATDDFDIDRAIGDAPHGQEMEQELPEMFLSVTPSTQEVAARHGLQALQSWRLKRSSVSNL